MLRRPPEEGLGGNRRSHAAVGARGVGDVKFETVESLPPKVLARRVVGEKDFGGTWICEIASASGGGTLAIDGTMAALRERFGES